MSHPKTAPENPPKFQRKVADFVADHALETPPYVRLLDLSSEAGELAKEYLKSTDYGRAAFEEPPESWEDELGDAFFSLSCLANSTSVDLETALQKAMNKYEERLRRGGDAGSGGGEAG